MKCVLTIPTGYNKDEGCPSNRQSSNMHNVKFVFFFKHRLCNEQVYQK